MNLFGDIDLMERILDVKLKRHELLANNLANVDTPGYKRRDISFEDVFQQNLNDLLLTTTNARHIKANRYSNKFKEKVHYQHDRSFRNDKNNVDIDKEMIEILKNTFGYNIISDQVRNKLKMLHTAISEGRK